MTNYLRDSVEYNGESYFTNDLLNICGRFELTDKLTRLFYEYERHEYAPDHVYDEEDFIERAEIEERSGEIELRNNLRHYRVTLDRGIVQSVRQTWPPKTFGTEETFDAIRSSIDALANVRGKAAVVLFDDLYFAVAASMNAHLYALPKSRHLAVEIADMDMMDRYPELHWLPFPHGVIGTSEEKEVDVERLQSQIAASEKKLANPMFLSRAPVNIVEREREKLRDLKGKIAAIRGHE